MNAQRRPLLLLGDILDAARDIQRFTSGMSQEQFANDRATVLIVERLLTIIGEAALRLRRDYEYDQHYPQIPWHRIVGTRHIITHLYDRVDRARVYRIAVNRIPELTEQIEAIMQQLELNQDQS
jgi:uncharacterized protein with HEPN domain